MTFHLRLPINGKESSDCSVDQIYVFILFLVRFGLLSGHLLGNRCPLC